MSETLCFQAAVGVPLHCRRLNFAAKSSFPVPRTATHRSPPLRRPRMASVITSPPSAHSENASSSEDIPSTNGAQASFSSSTPVQFVTELTSPGALDDVFKTLSGEASDGAEGPKLVFVEAYTKSCRACIGVRRIYERVAEEKQEVVRCLRFDAFNCGNLAQKLGVRGLPTFVIYKRSAERGDEGYEWKRVDHFTTSKRSVIEQNINDNL